MNLEASNSSQRASLWPWVYVIAIAYFTLHLATSTRYGYFRDALYYLACAEHLAFGYVDLQALFELRMAGWSPVLAHPERYGNAARDLADAEEWRRMGAALQVNAGSLL